MIIYPDGDGDGAGHISVYLVIIGKSSLHAVWEVNVSFSFLIFDQIHNNYNVMKGMERHFRNIKTEWGFSKCISHKTFKDPSNGYLVNDKCVVGVDVYVIKNQGIGCSGQNGQSISVFLMSVDAKGVDFPKGVGAKFSISIKNQISGCKHQKKSDTANWYSAASNSLGWRSFMPCCEFNDPKKGFLIEDCCIVEAECGRGWVGLDRLGFSRLVVPAPVITGLGDGTDKWKISACLACPGWTWSRFNPDSSALPSG
ncbi:hypothetical protein KY290_020460 [Solanum tuberosum]|uniref:MATH domain-containing protein n=1 Tax=Solanum tuberosum TaxID=4113 RepID=A0ABQ7V0T4_SOLTU|nr:hypothetical protein KY290_020460 [Solanum tuberosum]